MLDRPGGQAKREKSKKDLCTMACRQVEKKMWKKKIWVEEEARMLFILHRGARRTQEGAWWERTYI